MLTCGLSLITPSQADVFLVCVHVGMESPLSLNKVAWMFDSAIMLSARLANAVVRPSGRLDGAFHADELRI